MTDNNILLVAHVLADNLADQGWVVVDCRFDLSDPDAGRRRYEQKHIPGAVYLDLDRDLAGPIGPETGRHPLPDIEVITARLGELGINNEHRVVVYDENHGAIASRAWWILRWLGHDDVHLLDGGFAYWRSLELPTVSGGEAREACAFQANLRPELVLRTEELSKDLERISSLKLLDARDRSRFRGEKEPIDPVAGHIPGTINLPFSDFLNPDGTWLPLSARKRLMEALLGTDQEAAWSVMCGSGVTACHLAISGLEAGFSEPRVYVGSWSEWIRDPERPIGLGEG